MGGIYSTTGKYLTMQKLLYSGKNVLIHLEEVYMKWPRVRNWRQTFWRSHKHEKKRQGETTFRCFFFKKLSKKNFMKKKRKKQRILLALQYKHRLWVSRQRHGIYLKNTKYTVGEFQLINCNQNQTLTMLSIFTYSFFLVNMYISYW